MLGLIEAILDLVTVIGSVLDFSHPKGEAESEEQRAARRREPSWAD